MKTAEIQKAIDLLQEIRVELIRDYELERKAYGIQMLLFKVLDKLEQSKGVEQKLKEDKEKLLLIIGRMSDKIRQSKEGAEHKYTEQDMRKAMYRAMQDICNVDNNIDNEETIINKILQSKDNQ